MNPKIYSRDDLLAMSQAELWDVMCRAYAVDPGGVAGHKYIGIDLSLPAFVNKILWKTFRKTFYKDPETGVVRGWNVRMQQTGWDAPQEPMLDRSGQQKSFGHYHLSDATGIKFPRGWTGPSFLDYGAGQNKWWDLARFGYTPLVAVNDGDMSLLLGWEVMKVGPVWLPMSDYWLLVEDGPLDRVVPPPAVARRGR